MKMLRLTVSCFFLAVALINASHMKGVRIIGGDTASASQFPFAAAIYKITNSGNYFCTGSLINSQWILTSGQCVDNASLFTLRLGSNSLSRNDPEVLKLATDSYFLHPEYNSSNLDNDIGLIKLRLPISFTVNTDFIKPVTMLTNVPIPQGTEVLTLGWGQTSDEQAGLVDLLQYVNLVSLSHEECTSAYGNQITVNMLCAEGNYNEGTCRGDLGSPLLLVQSHSLWVQVGISSFISSRGCESLDPSGFTRVGPYLQWIHNVTSYN